MLNFIRGLIRPKYKSLNKIQIDQANLLANLEYLQSLQPQNEIWPILKSNAYGHGLKEVCRILNFSKIDMIGVDSYPEAQIAYKNFNRKILILNELPLKAYRYCYFKRSEFVVYNLATIKYLAHHHRGAKVHLFINTGMNREGIGDLETLLISAEKYLRRLNVVGLASHLAAADKDSILNQTQIAKFWQSLDIIKSHGFNPTKIHLGNSAAIFWLKDERLTAWRTGISFYGYNPFTPTSPYFAAASKLKPALTALSTITGEQEVEPGASVSYDENFQADRYLRIALVPFGYYEGLDRKLSNQAQFKVLSQPVNFYAPIAGNVCMNLICLNTFKHEFKIGDPVEIISPQPDDLNSVQKLANLSQTIPYEVLISLQANIRREII